MNILKLVLFFIAISFTNPLLAEPDGHNDHKDEHAHEDEHEHENHDDEDAFEEHSSHVHGHATAQITYVENVLNIRKTLSSIDVFGFEHAPKNEEQNNSITQSMSIMENSELLFRFKNNACELESAHIENELDESDTDSPQDHDDHEDEHHHDEESHDKDSDEESHSDVIAEYIFKCDEKKFESIEYLIFEHFPSLEEIAVEYIANDHQALFKASPSNRVQKLH